MKHGAILNVRGLWAYVMARKSTPFLGIDPKMYRHFAALTLGISCTVALFADGEAQQAMAQSQKQAELKRAERQKFGSTKLADHRSDEARRPRSSGYRDGNGAPMDAGGDGAGGIIPANLSVSAAPVIVEIDQAALARMTPQQRIAYLKMLEAERRKRMAQGPVMPTQAQIDSLAADSAMRSGSESID